MLSETRFKISVPRFQRSPVDTFRFSQMMKKRRVSYKPVSTTLIERIREIVISETGYDPYHEPENRLKEFVTARQLFIYFVRKYAKLSQKATGTIVGKDHSTVNWAEKCVKKFRILEPEYCQQFDNIENKILKIINP
jgi:chromosomal replication initiation ATPase DnaA